MEDRVRRMKMVDSVMAEASALMSKSFKEQWGIEPGTARSLFEGALPVMLAHVAERLSGAMRDDDDRDNMLRLQGALRLLDQIRHIPDAARQVLDTEMKMG